MRGFGLAACSLVLLATDCSGSTRLPPRAEIIAPTRPAVRITSAPASMIGPAPFRRIRVRECGWSRDPWIGDEFRVDIEGDDGSAIRLDFISSYGMFEVQALPALPGGEALLTLQYGRGRGTGVRSEAVRVFRLRGRTLCQVLQVPISGYEYGGRERGYALWSVAWGIRPAKSSSDCEFVTGRSDLLVPGVSWNCTRFRWLVPHSRFEEPDYLADDPLVQDFLAHDSDSIRVSVPAQSRGREARY